MTARARSPRAQRTYSITFPEGQEPPVNGFWSLTLYNDKHLFHPNDLKRYSLDTKNKKLKRNDDGSLTLYAGAIAWRGQGVETGCRRPKGPSPSTSALIGARRPFSTARGSRRRSRLSAHLNVRLWHLADIDNDAEHVCS